MCTVFVGWTVTSAVFQDTGSKVAANFTIVMIVRLQLHLSRLGLITNLHTRVVPLLRFLRYRLYPLAGRLRSRDLAIHHPRQGIRRHEFHDQLDPHLQPIRQPRCTREVGLEVLSLVSVSVPASRRRPY